MNQTFRELPAMSAERWNDWTEDWIKHQFPTPRTYSMLVLHDENGHEWFLRWAGSPHVHDEEGTGLCDECGQRSFVWAANWALGRLCLLCFKRNDEGGIDDVGIPDPAR